MTVIRLPIQHRDPVGARVASALAALASVMEDEREPALLRAEAARVRARLVEVNGMRHVLLQHEEAQADAEGL